MSGSNSNRRNREAQTDGERESNRSGMLTSEMSRSGDERRSEVSGGGERFGGKDGDDKRG